MKNIVLVGFLGTGKTTIGRRVAGKLVLDFYDTDEYIKRCEGMSASQVLEKKGAKYFEGAQRFAVQNICENKNALIATGGTTLSDSENLALLLKNSILVWLRSKPETIYENTIHSHNKRPELSGKSVADIAGLMAQYEPDYRRCHIAVDVDKSRNIDDAVEEVVAQIKNYKEHEQGRNYK